MKFLGKMYHLSLTDIYLAGMAPHIIKLLCYEIMQSLADKIKQRVYKNKKSLLNKCFFKKYGRTLRRFYPLPQDADTKSTN